MKQKKQIKNFNFLKENHLFLAMLIKASGNSDQWCFSEAEKSKIKMFVLHFFSQRNFDPSNERKSSLFLGARFNLIWRQMIFIAKMLMSIDHSCKHLY
jgi:hypothetical protein